MSKTNENKLVPKLRFPEFINEGEWTEKKFDDLCKFIRGPFGGALKKEIFVSEGYAVYEQQHAIYGDFTTFRYFITEEKFNEMKRFSVLPKDIIMSCSGTMGKFAVVPEKPKEGVINQALLKLTVKSGYEVGFIKTTLELPVNQNKLLSQSAGGAIKNVVEVAQIKEIKLFIPPIKEQQKIASCLSSLDEVITAESQKLEVLKEHKRGLLQNLFPAASTSSATGETVPKLRFKEFENSGEWVFDTFSEYIKLYRGSSPRPIQNYFTTDESGVNWIKIGDTKNADSFTINQVEERITPEGAEKSRKVNIGELILANSMSFGKTYQLAIEGYIYDGWFVLREFEKHFDKQFLIQLLNSEYMQRQYKKLSAGGIVQNISSDIVYNTVLPHTSVNEQKRIASCLSSLDEIISAQSQKVETLKHHKKGLLQGLFPTISNEE